MMPREPAARGRPTGGNASRRARRPSTPFADDPAQELIGERDREAFLDILSHELRTPVTTIYGGAQLLASKDLAPDRRRALAEDVRGEADRLYRLVEDLVVLVRSERDGIRPIGEPVAIGHLVMAAIEREIVRHPEAHIRLLGDGDATAEGADEALLTHVIRNLLDNAIRYGGTAGPIEVIIGGSSTEVTVRVIDRGASPTPDEQPFRLSERKHATAARRAGAGIGLYVADRLIRAMHGRMWAARPGRNGAEFGFALARSTSPRAGGDA
jgi:two-component system, OmpR family, sensor histidine kinase KdpD